MLVSPPPAVNVKLSHQNQVPIFIQQPGYHLPNFSDRQFPFKSSPNSSNPHVTHENQLELRLNWDTSLTSEAFQQQDRPLNSSMERKPGVIAHLPDLCTSHPSSSSVSPPSNEYCNNPSRGSAISFSVTPTTRRSLHPEREDSEVKPLIKRLRPLSLSQLEAKCSAKYSYQAATISGSSSPKDDNDNIYKCDSIKAEDITSLPPIITREEHENDILSSEPRLLVDPCAVEPDQRRCHSNAGSEEALEASSVSHRVEESNSNLSPLLDKCPPHSPGLQHPNPLGITIHNSSESLFTSDQYAQASSQPHTAASSSFNSSQQSPHPPTFHDSGSFLFTLPPSSSQRADFQQTQYDRTSYPASPTMTMSAPNSATFPSDSSTPFGSLSPQMSSVSAQMSHLASTRRSPLHASGAPPSTTSVQSTPHWAPVESRAQRRRGKLPQAVTSILKKWLMEHTTHPYPTEEQKKSLCDETNLSLNQVSNWFINARRRILVPPTGANSVHEVRQPMRRQAQSQLARAAANSGGIPPPSLALRRSQQSTAGTALVSPPLFSPISTTPGAMGGATFDLRYSVAPPSHSQEHALQVSPLNGCRPNTSVSYGQGPWESQAYTIRTPAHAHLYASVGGQHGGGPTTYYSAPQSPYPHYNSSHSASSTPLPSPQYPPPPPYNWGPNYQAHSQRMHSPRQHSESHPSTPTLLRPISQPHQPALTYVCTQASPSKP